MSKQSVIYIPGLGNKPEVQEQVPEAWLPHGLDVELQRIDWKDSDYTQRLEAIGQRIITLAKESAVSIIGASAGGKTALSLYARHSELLHRIVLVNAKIPPYDKREPWWQTFPNLVASSEILAHDLLHMAPAVHERILCAISKTDETITVEPNQPYQHPSVLAGATTFAMPIDGHVAGIAYALTDGKQQLINFILQQTHASPTPV